MIDENEATGEIPPEEPIPYVMAIEGRPEVDIIP